MNKSSINIDVNREYTLKVTGGDIVHLITAMGELPHKIGGPLENKILSQIPQEQKV